MRDWVQDEWEHFGLFMDAMNDRQVAMSDMNDMAHENHRKK